MSHNFTFFLILRSVFWMFLTIICCCLYSVTVAQDTTPFPCGTVAEKSKWLAEYQRSPHQYRSGSDTVLYVPMTVHIVGSTNGLGYYSYTNMLNAMCQLNADMEPSNIQFFLAGEVNYINNSAWYSHSTVLEGADMMFANNVAGTLNSYIVSDPAGNCGYNLPYAGIALNPSCIGPGDHTWAHEVGHAFSLPHPFLGWEGGVSHDNSVSHSYGNPAPTSVLYDYTYFLDTLIRDTMIIDTALVEYVDGRNCHLAADGFCDTAPDYLSFRWNCNGQGVSSTTQHDPDGEAFTSDGSLIMSYSDDNCQVRFSAEQISAMRANLYDEKPELLTDPTPQAPVTATAELIAPTEAEVLFVDVGINRLEWAPIPEATRYVVQFSRLQSFSGGNPITQTLIVDHATEVVIEGLDAFKTYYWRVRGFNDFHFCSDFSEVRSFSTDQLASISAPTVLQTAQVFPNPTHHAASTWLQIDLNEAARFQLSLTDALGRTETRQTISLGRGVRTLELPTQDLVPGIYWVRLENGEGVWAERLVIW